MNSGSLRSNLRVLRRSLLALFLSILSPGLGQVYNGQLLKGALLYTSVPLFLKLASLSRLLLSYRGFLLFAALGILLFGGIAVDAMRGAQRRGIGARHRRGWRTYLLAATMLLVTVVGLAGRVPDRLLGAHAYKVPEEGMAPTMLRGDRVMVDLRYYDNHPPQRGDVVALANFIGAVSSFSRVVALPGDVIEGTPNSITVNGRPVNEPYLKYLPDAQHDPGGIRLTFGPFIVPEHSLFVMGDFRSHSFDSRRFGAAAMERLKGRVLYVISSADKSQVSRPVR